MTKTKDRASAAIVGLLDAIKLEGIKPIDHDPTLPIETSAVANNNHLSLKTNIDEVPKFTIIEVDTDKVSPWYMANRLNDYITESSCEELIESIKNVGQQIPALLRKTKNKDHYELICGARRLFACKILGLKLLAAVVDLSDKEALLAMDAENRPRNDISAYERALDYKNWIEKGIYKNQADICKTIGMKKSLFTQIFSLSEIDEAIVRAFGHPNNLSIRWGYQLAKACKNSAKRKVLLAKAAEITKLDLKPTAAYAALFTVIKADASQKKSNSRRTYINKTSDVNLQIHYGKTANTIQIKTLDDNKELDRVLKFLIKELNLVLVDQEKV